MGNFFSKKTTRQLQIEAEIEAVYKKMAKTTGATVGDIREWHYVFRSQYPRGITEAQFIAENMECHGGSQYLWAHIFASLDEKQEGVLGFSQFVTLLHRRKTNPVERRMKDAFKFFDKDFDTTLSEGELQTGFIDLYSMPETRALLKRSEELGVLTNMEATDPGFRAKAMLARFDFDNDGCLNEHEFVESCKSDQMVQEALSTKRSISE
jgi:Ca2+-binding EF-hand superfamily protein